MFFGLTILGQQTENSPCSFENPYNVFENGLQSSSEHTQVVANDFIVSAGNSFVLSEMIFNFITSDDITLVDVAYYMDDGGVPGTKIGMQDDIIPVSSIDIGDFGLIVMRVTLDVDDFTFTALNNTDTPFWISIVCTNASGDDLSFWEITTATQESNPSAINDDNMGWELYDHGDGSVWDGVYEFIGDCILETEENFVTELELYPNPVKNFVTVNLSNSEILKSVVIYNISGKRKKVSFIGATIDLSEVASGFYILEVVVNEVIYRHNIIKS